MAPRRSAKSSPAGTIKASITSTTPAATDQRGGRFRDRHHISPIPDTELLRRPPAPLWPPTTLVRFWPSTGGPEPRMPFTQLSRALSYGQSSYNLQELIQIVECLLKPVKSRVTQFRSK